MQPDKCCKINGERQSKIVPKVISEQNRLSPKDGYQYKRPCLSEQPLIPKHIISVKLLPPTLTYYYHLKKTTFLIGVWKRAHEKDLSKYKYKLSAWQMNRFPI